MACEGQFDFNLSFKAELKKLELVSDKPLGTDHEGQRYWLLKVGMRESKRRRGEERERGAGEGGGGGGGGEGEGEGEGERAGRDGRREGGRD